MALDLPGLDALEQAFGPEHQHDGHHHVDRKQLGHRCLGSIEGAAVGALIVGLARSFAVHLAPVAELFSVYVVMAIVLMFRPEGLFQRIQARKI